MPPRKRTATTRKPATRKTATRKTPTRKTAITPDVPTAGPGERVWLLDVPFRTAAPGAQFVKKWKSYAWVGSELPTELLPFKALPFSYQQWVEDDINGGAGERPTSAPKIPRPVQVSGAAAVVDAARAGRRGFLLADNAGLGKTLIAIMAAKTIAEERGESSILVLVDRPAQITIPHWRYSIASVGDGGFRWLIMSPDQLKKLIARNGRPKYTFGVVIADEAQLYSNDTQRTAAFEKVARFPNSHDQSPFVLSVTATPGHTPADQRYLAPLFAQLHDEPSEYWSDLGARLLESGLPLDKSYGKWTWSAEAKESPTLQASALETVRGWLSNSKPPLMIHRRTPWGPVPLDGMPIDLTPSQRAQYETEWAEYAYEMGLARKSRNIARGRALVLRYRQKAGMIRAESTAQWAQAQVKAGKQVLVAVEFVSTAGDPLVEMIEDSGISVAKIFGAVTDKEHQRLRFQRGEAPVVVFNVTTSISLHANEALPDGTHASPLPRTGIFHQPRYSGIAAEQTFGRSHRDYQTCPWLIPFGVGTKEEDVATTMLRNLQSVTGLKGGDQSGLRSLAELLGVEWLEPDVLTAER
ncbi:DEAD/DEAH box helicase [Rhodococcus sp. AD45-ID]|uniref:DEAD/DEAH box helicase family protein n=1 Tax=unclassified Rhodococcus (in: high G+C Gram-positive bacteria) TaxID=192944 RepID=UPI0005D37D69|nr:MULTISPECIES: DEAD/DEAH box helicase family protein [unclassified Rhodococcus (in: high G+C Gram-positive bacteria)]KJF21314.1 hypothetical protein SZ00_04521 [Rhodococcus sp. AD45]PSR38812.1 DEAD/DEAH box helicase [Rhodococcus sp. AD45-ID]